ncbi:MAG: monovalent cation:proton antiporter-2 (CPA2) family protein [Gammaproteobacteria bacterium]|nr:monovalent cation:proton antiporter-2 (CPA2) family protein [Gammaproteobacteria bacterium]
MNNPIFHEILLLLAASVIAVAAIRRLALPPILGYLCVGVLVGPHGMGWIPDTENTRVLGEFGVVFLLFSVGLEFSLPQLAAMKNVVFGVGGAQVITTTALAGLAAWLLGVAPKGAFVLGGLLAMSSTAIVIKQLTEQMEINSRHGRLAVGMLLFQDLAVIPFLALIPMLAHITSTTPLAPLAWALAKSAAAFFVLLAAGHGLLRPLFREVAAARSSELFTLTVLLCSLAAAWATHLIGLPLALGGFLAGMMLGETEFRHQVEADIRPFRDVLLGLFFITVGMLLDVRSLSDLWYWVLALVIAIAALKTSLIMALARYAGAERGVALRTGLVLAQGGEFSFALLSLALAAGLIDPRAGQIVLAAVLISMAVAPMLIRYNGPLAKRLFPVSYHLYDRSKRVLEVAADSRDLDRHVIICGYGRIGQNIARFLERESIEFVALDLDPERVREARAAGDRVNYGDSTHLELLEAAGLHRARALVVSFDDAPSSLKILRQVRTPRPDLPVLVRTRDDADLEQLQQAGATEVVPETLEASLMLVSHLLVLLQVPVSRVLRSVRDVRADRYRLLRGFFHGQEPVAPEESDRTRERLHAVTLPEGAHAVGRTLAQLGLDGAGITVTAVRRGGMRGPQPHPDTQLRAGDVLVLYGVPENLEKAEEILLQG